MALARRPLPRAATATAACIALAGALLAGCADPQGLGPARRLGAAVPTQGPQGQQGPGERTPWPDEHWWQVYGDAGLDALVDRALQGQPALQAALARVRQAEAAADAQGAARRPQVGLAVELIDQRYTENGLFPPPLAGATRWTNSAQIGARWDLDLFGRQRAAFEAAVGQWRAVQADAQAARVLLAGRVAATWFELARLLESRAIAARSLQQREQVLALVRERLAAGLDTALELRQAEGLIAQAGGDIEALDEQLARTRHALAELSAQAPDALAAAQPALAALRERTLPATLPADLLGRRADLVAQRWRVESALRDVDSARAQFYPDIDLAAFVGLSSLGLERLLRAGSLTAGAGPALHLPLFDGGRLRAQLGARSAQADAAIEAYDATLLRALREVADEIASLRSLARQQHAQADAGRAAEAAHALARQRFEAGLGNVVAVLNAESAVLAQRRAAADLKARQLAADAALQAALGGGYQARDLPAGVARSR
jgi:NodT family efflux transporter outer membrane factor (OMF) lipoprotein